MLDISRHRDLFNPEQFKEPVHIVGAGATGSWLALMLAKLGIEDITVWDFDVVEEHNIANQAYRTEINGRLNVDIGKYKVSALSNVIKNFTSANIKTKIEHVTPSTRLSGIVFMMVDTMKARQEIWEGAIKLKPQVKLFVEPRMGLDMGRIYNVNPTDLTHIERYEQEFYDDDVAEVSACGASKTVITTAMNVASICARQLINWHNQTDLPNEIQIDYLYNNLFTTKWE